MDALFVTTSKRIQLLCNFTRKLNLSQKIIIETIYTHFVVEVSNYLERKCPQLFKAHQETQLYGLVKLQLLQQTRNFNLGRHEKIYKLNEYFTQQRSFVSNNI